MYSYDYGYNYDMTNGLWHMSAGSSFISLLLSALVIVSLWFLFKKAGEEGWAAIVPFYNLYILFKITWGSGIKFLLLLIPIANIVIMIITMVKLAKAFGKGGGWACGIIFLGEVFLPIMAFSKDIVYVGVPGNPAQNGAGYGQPGYQGYQQPNGYQGYQQQGYQQQGYQAPPPQQNAYQAPPQPQPSAQNPDYYYQQTAAPSGPKFCPGCGAPIEGSVKFCPKCGKAL